MKIYLVLLLASLSAFGNELCPEEETTLDKISARVNASSASQVFTHTALSIDECANQIIKDDMKTKGHKVLSIHSESLGQAGHYYNHEWPYSTFENGGVANMLMTFEGRHGRTLEMFGGEVRIFVQKSTDGKSVHCAVNPDPTYSRAGIWYSPEKRPWYELKSGFRY
ncbi:MAG: hypothetical protein ACJ76H_12855 [Bacteriovoracaceae bacterium]